MRQELQRCLIGGSINLFLVQEHHLSNSRVKRYDSLLSGRYETFWSVGFGPMEGQGGVCMSIAEVWQPSVLERSVLVPGRAQVVTVQYHGGILGILNVYAPNHASARAEFWLQIASSLPRADCWCMGGDFNMLESPYDRVGGSQTSVHDRELAAWEQLCMTEDFRCQEP